MARLYFKKRFHESIRRGIKIATLRRWRACRVAAGQRVLAPGAGWLQILSAEEVIWEQLTDIDAIADGFASMSEFAAAIRRIYPDQHADGRKWFRVRFRWDGPDKIALMAKAAPKARVKSRKSTTKRARRELASLGAFNPDADKRLLAAAVRAKLDKALRANGS
jgi:hypothetical protein